MAPGQLPPMPVLAGCGGAHWRPSGHAMPGAGASAATGHCDQPDRMLARWSATTFPTVRVRTPEPLKLIRPWPPLGRVPNSQGRGPKNPKRFWAHLVLCPRLGYVGARHLAHWASFAPVLCPRGLPALPPLASAPSSGRLGRLDWGYGGPCWWTTRVEFVVVAVALAAA